MAWQRCWHSNSQICEKVTLYGRTDFAYVIKLKTLRWRIYSGLFLCPQYNHRALLFLLFLFLHFSFSFLIVHAFTVVPFFPLFPPSSKLMPSHSQSPPHCSCPWVMHKCSLSNPFTLFQPVPTTLLPLPTTTLFLVSVLLILFCALVYFLP